MLRGQAHGVLHILRALGEDHGGRRRRLQGGAAGISLLRRQQRAFARNAADMFHVNWLQNALALPRARRPALVTVLGTDMQLLRLPGMRAMLRRKFRGRAVVVCPNADWMLPELQAAGYGAYLVKPVRARSLSAVIETLLGHGQFAAAAEPIATEPAPPALL